MNRHNSDNNKYSHVNKGDQIFNNILNNSKMKKDKERYLDSKNYKYWPEISEDFEEVDYSTPLEIKNTNNDLPKADLDEISEDSSDDDENPAWYKKELKKKIVETKTRLSKLSNCLYDVCDESTKSYLNRIIEDHETPLCRLDLPLHLPLNKPWNNSWKFICIQTCKSSQNHDHNAKCIKYEFQQQDTYTKKKLPIILECLYPSFIQNVVKVFEDFINSYFVKNISRFNRYLEEYRPIWNSLMLRSNCYNEIFVTIDGNNIISLLEDMRCLFTNNAIMEKFKIASIYYINHRFLKKNSSAKPKLLMGNLLFTDTVGPIKLFYDSEMPSSINTLEIKLLCEQILKILRPSLNTTILLFGNSFRIICNILAHSSKQVIVFSNKETEINEAKIISSYNKIKNVYYFFEFKTLQSINSKVQNFIQNKLSLVILSQNFNFGEGFIRSLRNTPTVLKILIIGSFKEKYSSILTLMRKDHKMGEPFYPVQGNVIDNSPIWPDEFEIIILFERKSFIEMPLDHNNMNENTIVGIEEQQTNIDGQYLFEKCIDGELDDSINIENIGSSENNLIREEENLPDVLFLEEIKPKLNLENKSINNNDSQEVVLAPNPSLFNRIKVLDIDTINNKYKNSLDTNRNKKGTIDLRDLGVKSKKKNKRNNRKKKIFNKKRRNY